MADEVTTSPATGTPDQQIESRIGAALFPKQDRPRAPDGKFIATTDPQEPPPEAPTEPQEAPEAPQEGEPEAPVEDPNAQVEGADAQPVSWDEVKEAKVKIPMKDGSREWEEELTLEELRLGHMRQADYSRNIQKAKADQAAAQNQVLQATAQIRQQAIAELASYEQAIFAIAAPQFQGVDMNRLAQEDPARWAQLRQTQENFNGTLYQIRSAKQQLEEAQALETQQSRAQAAQQANETLRMEIPNWGPDLDRALANMVTSDYGFRPDELAQGVLPLTDARVIRMANDLYKWRQLQAQKPLATKKVSEAPKVLRPGAKRDPGEGQRQRLEALREQVRKTGAKGQQGEDALAALLHQRMYGKPMK